MEVAERNYEQARAELNQANKDVARNQERQAKAVQAYNSRKSELDAANKTLADAKAEIKTIRAICPRTNGCWSQNVANGRA